MVGSYAVPALSLALILLVLERSAPVRLLLCFRMAQDEAERRELCSFICFKGSLEKEFRFLVQQASYVGVALGERASALVKLSPRSFPLSVSSSGIIR